MKKSVLYVSLVSVMALGTFSAYANHHEGKHESEKSEMNADTNNDGKVSFDEFKAAREKHMEEHFKRRDTNADGFIDEAERKAAKENWKEHRQEKMKK